MTALPRLRDLDDPTFDPFLADEAMYGATFDPYPVLAKLRAEGPVHRGDYRDLMGAPRDITLAHLPHYTVLGYDEVAKALLDPETFSNAAYKHSIGRAFGESISTMDAPVHTRYRRIFQKAFMPNVVAKWGESVVDSVVESLIGKFVHRGYADLVEEFTLHFPFQIIYRQLALPEADVKTFHKLAVAQLVVVFDIERGLEANRKLGEYFKALVVERRAHPGDDLVSVLAAAEVDGEKLPEEILISFLRQLVTAGGDTTYRTTSTLLMCLLKNPNQLELLLKDRALIANAIDEALRWDGPVLIQTRQTTKDATLGGVTIPAGCVVDVCAGSANRDGSHWPDPDRFDVKRERGANRNFSFSSGPHICIGQHLARVEMTRAINAVLDRLPGLRIDPDKEPPHSLGSQLRAPKHLYVRFDV